MTYEDQAVIVNLPLMKKCRFYQMLKPNDGGGVNVFRLTFMMLVLLEQVPFMYGNVGLFVPTEYTIGPVEYLQAIYGDIQYTLTKVIVFALLYNADAVWDLFDVAGVDFLRSARCRVRATSILRRRRATLVLYTDCYYMLSIIITIQWVSFPVVYNWFVTHSADGDDDAAAAAQNTADDQPPSEHKLNIVNLPYPLTAESYDRHYWTIFAGEAWMNMFLLYTIVFIDTTFLSFGWAIVSQYEVLAQAFADLAQKPANDDGVNPTSDYDDLISVIYDQQRLCSKFKSFFSIVKPILLVYIAIASSSIVLMTFTFVLMFSSPEMFSILTAVKVASTVLYLCIELYIYCYLFDTINIRREAVNFGLYSCDWTSTDLKFKKLLLMTMQINNAEQTVLKATPRKIINLQFFFSVITTSYNIVSVMANSMKRTG